MVCRLIHPVLTVTAYFKIAPTAIRNKLAPIVMVIGVGRPGSATTDREQRSREAAA